MEAVIVAGVGPGLGSSLFMLLLMVKSTLLGFGPVILAALVIPPAALVIRPNVESFWGLSLFAFLIDLPIRLA